MNAVEESSLWSCLTSKDLWLQELRRGEVDIFVAVLLSQLPSLKRLTIGSDFQRDTPFIGDTISSNSGSTPKQLFPALESVTYSNDIVQDLDVAYHFVHLDQVLPLFYMGRYILSTYHCPLYLSLGHRARFPIRFSHHLSSATLSFRRRTSGTCSWPPFV